MSGTAADEQQMKEVEAGIPRPSHSNVRRSVSNASANTESHRKLDNIRRNVSVSSRNSRQSNNAQSPGTPSSMAGGGVHRSNTLPSKMGPVATSARYARAHESASNNPSGLAVSHQSSRSTSRTPSVREEPEQPVTQPASQAVHQQIPRPISQPAPQLAPEPLVQPVTQPVALPIPDIASQPVVQPVAQSVPQPPAEAPENASDSRHNSQSTAFSATLGNAYVHTSTHGPLPPAAAERLIPTEIARPQENLHTPIASPSPVVTPSRERKLTSLFSKSPPPDGETREPRQPNRLRKKRIPGSASMSAQSSTTSLHASSTDPSAELNFTNEHSSEVVGDTTPRPPNTATLGGRRESASESNAALVEGAPQHQHEHSLRPHKSRTPSMNSRSSFTDQSDLDQPEDGSRNEPHENRRSWRFHRSSKSLGLGLSSPPLIATNPGAEHSTSSIGSGHYQASELSNHPLSLDAGVQSTTSISQEPEKMSLFGKFKAKVAQVRDGVKDERERTKSPSRSDTDPSLTSHPLSPIITDSSNSNPPAESSRENAKEEGVRSPTSPFPGAGLPPPIPEEPHSPVMATASPVLEQAPGTEPVPVSEPVVSDESSNKVAEPSTTA
jgi:hypothetical protein